MLSFMFFINVENLLTAHLCSSLSSGLDVLVASHQKELMAFTLFCKIIFIQSSWELI